jgi:hypothetical protein
VGTDEKWVLWFNEHPKGLSLNNTKIRLLEAAFGDDSEYWTHKRVRLTFDPTVMMAGQVVGGIKLTCSTLQAQRPSAPQPGYGGVPQAGRPHPGTNGPVHPGAAPGAPPAPHWDGQRWVLPAESSPAPAAEFDKSTGEIYQRPKTISERIDEGHPSQAFAPPSSPAEFDDDIPF